MKKIVVPKTSERIDKFLKDNLDESRSTIIKMLTNGYITVNKKQVKPSYLVKENDIIEIKENYQKEQNIIPKKINIDIIYEDEDIIVVNKPSGLTVHPGSGNKEDTLVNALMEHTKNLSDINGQNRLGIVHRIDKDTSGLLLVAKNNKAHQILAEGFKNKTIIRHYIALVCGVINHETGTIDAPIGRDEKNRLKMQVTAKNSKKAITHFQVLKRYTNYTLLKLKLDTGRTHQIRVHMQYIGYPIYNDPLYNKGLSSQFGQFLHSASLEFEHPITKKRLYFECPLPKEFNDFLTTLN